MKRASLIAFTLWLTAGACLAVQPDEILADKALEARARALSAELRCLVCQNQSIDDSDAPLARDLRLLLRERLKAGDTDAEARQYLVARYGDFVLLKPPFNMVTLMLWAGPFLVLLLAAGLLAARRPAPQAPEEAPISPEEAERLKRLI